jgi:hypothetical protein
MLTGPERFLSVFYGFKTGLNQFQSQLVSAGQKLVFDRSHSGTLGYSRATPTPTSTLRCSRLRKGF